MDNKSINQVLLSELAVSPDAISNLFPKTLKLKENTYFFRTDFGLEKLPQESGILIVRGPRQYGKSTWLELKICETISQFGPGSALYLNGDEIINHSILYEEISQWIKMFRPTAKVKRLFIDEITAVESWEKALKRLSDSGELSNILVVTTGSKAQDLRRGSERLPGRKGKLRRTNYLFTPIRYAEFHRVCGEMFGKRSLYAYLISGGCPIACSELAKEGRLPDYIISMVRDWIFGECTRSGRLRSNLMAITLRLFKHGGLPMGFSKLARETGLANNTVAMGYIEMLADLMCVAKAFPWDISHQVLLKRKAAKFHWINMLAAVSFSPHGIRTLDDFENIPLKEQGMWLEWLIAQELWRRAAIRGEEFPEEMGFYASKEHELDFMLSPQDFLEVKRGQTSSTEFMWLHHALPKAHLTVLSQSSYKTAQITGRTLEEFLMET